MPYQTIDVDSAGPVARVVLNRPDVRNAFNDVMIAELTDAFQRLGGSDAVRVIVLRGAGPSFSAGADISWMRASLQLGVEANIADARRMSDMFATIDEVPKPVVAIAHGAALGGGMGLLAVSDIAIAVEGTKFGFTEAKLGIIPAVISPFVLPKIGESWARALFLSAERFGTELAHRIGLVHWVAPPDNLDNLVEQKVNDVLTSGPAATAAAKRLIRELREIPSDRQRARTAERIAKIRAGAEGQAGLGAFLERRRAPWAG